MKGPQSSDSGEQFSELEKQRIHYKPGLILFPLYLSTGWGYKAQYWPQTHAAPYTEVRTGP